jgi:hypothetical protein
MCFVKNLKKCHDLNLIVASGVIGYFCMTHSAALPVTALIIPVLWILAGKRVSAFFIILAYHLTISRGLVSGAAVFLSETHTHAGAFLLWLLMGIGVSLPFFIFWHTDIFKKAICLFSALLFAYFLPPVALIGVVNPMMMSGCLFPGWGFYGLLVVLFIYFFCVIGRSFSLAFIVIIALFPVTDMGELKPPATPAGFYAMNTSFGKLGSGSFNFADDYERAHMVFGDIIKTKAWELDDIYYIVLPETIAGRLNNTGIHLWSTELKKLLRPDQSAIFGGEIPTDNGRKYDNAMLLNDGDDIRIIAQRIPVPYSMYRGPFAKTGANLHLWEDGILVLPDERKAAVIICYEAFLTLPFILSFLQNPELILWTGNQWWCKDTSLPLIQERSVAIWSQLFDVPALIVKNR